MVLDARALVDLILGFQPNADWVKSQIRSAEELRAPHLLDFEVAHAVRRQTLNREISPGRGAVAMRDLRELRLRRFPAAGLLTRVWELRNILSAYDASYIALAELLDAPLLTTDRSLGQTRGHRARVLTP
jgi:predicted nucleic acid-binding protein